MTEEDYDEWAAAHDAEYEKWLMAQPGAAALMEMEERYPGLDFELTEDGEVVCTTIPN